MNKLILPLVAACALVGPALAQDNGGDPRANDQAVAQARSDYQAAMRAHNRGAARSAEARMRAAYGESAEDAQAIREADARPPKGVPHNVHMSLVRAREHYREAMLAGRPDRVEAAKAEVRSASAEEWKYAHAEPHGQGGHQGDHRG